MVDRLNESLMAAAGQQRADPTAFIANRSVFGNLVAEPRFVSAYTSALHSLHERGARATMADY